MTDRLIIASNNSYKISEIKSIIGGFFGVVLSQRESGVELEVDETGDTFEENAMIKALALHSLDEAKCCAVLADDSGLCVDALLGAPGVKSARFAAGVSGHGEIDADTANNLKLLDLMRTVPDEKRGCAFVSCVALIMPDGTAYTARGECRGIVLRELQGAGGFGYDPLFFLPELHKSYAELTPLEKNSVSHRGRALAELKKTLAEAGYGNA